MHKVIAIRTWAYADGISRLREIEGGREVNGSYSTDRSDLAAELELERLDGLGARATCNSPRRPDD